jgi:DNA ligase-1
MPDLEDGETAEVQGSAEKPYELKNTGGVYSCSCPAWRNQRGGIERRTCKHLKAYRGEAAELARVGAENIAGKPGTKAASASASAAPAASSSGSGSKAAVKKDTAPPVLLAHAWENDVDLTGWWMSEKLDGVRAYWDGTMFVSRLGNQFLAPKWFVEGLPDHPLDGELWIGRKQFQETISVVRRTDQSDEWKKVRYVLFDAPGIEGPFEQRIEFLREKFGPGAHEFTSYLEHVTCTGNDHLREELARVEALGGEGLMMRMPGSKYVAGRSSTLLKVKNFYDAEARVVAHVPGKGKHKGRLGALDVELPDGTRFSVGTGLSEKEREDPPPLGAVITFRYQELTDGGVPRFPSYVGMRPDVSWPPEGAAATAPKKVNKGDKKTAAPVVVSAPAKPAAKATAAPAAGGKRRFEFKDGSSAKFWEVAVVGSDMTTTWGKLGGSSSSSKTKGFASAAAAQAEAAKLVAEKTKGGYVEVGGATAPAELEVVLEEDDDVAPPASEAESGELAALAAPAPPPASKKVAAPPAKPTPPPPVPAKPATPPAPEPEAEPEAEEGEEAEAELDASVAPAGPARTTPEGVLPPKAHVPAPVRSAPARLLVREAEKRFVEVAVIGDTLVERAGTLGAPGRTVARQHAGHGSALTNAEALVAARLAEGFEEAPADKGKKAALERAPAPRYLVHKKAATYCELAVVGDTVVERSGPAGSAGRTMAWQSADPAAARKDADARVAARASEGFVEA